MTFPQTEVNLKVTGGPVEYYKTVSVPFAVLFTYPHNIDNLKRRRFSLTSPKVAYN